MLEILVICHIAGKVGDMAYRKGYNPGPFSLLIGGLWFVGEALGFVIGINMGDGPGIPWGTAYLLAVAFALFGAFVGFIVVVALPGPALKKRKRQKLYDLHGNPIVRDELEVAGKRRRRRREEGDVRDEGYRTRSRRRQDDNREEEEYRPRPRRRAEDRYYRD
jgi:hypothetical protein